MEEQAIVKAVENLAIQAAPVIQADQVVLAEAAVEAEAVEAVPAQAEAVLDLVPVLVLAEAMGLHYRLVGKFWRRFIKKRHGSNETARGQMDITPDDFALIPLVLNEFDRMEHDLTDKQGFKKVLFKKRCEETIYIATIERGENKVEVRTFWKMRVPGASC